MKHVIDDLFNFVITPKDKRFEDRSNNFNMKVFLSIFALDMIVMVAATILTYTAQNLGLIPEIDNEIEALYNEHPKVLITFLILIVVPLIEEFFFRFPLVYNRNFVLRFFESMTKGSPMQERMKNENNIKTYWNRYYKYFFYGSAVIFALFHLTNYSMDSLNIISIILFTLPLFVMAIFFGYLRVRINFFYGFLLHAMHNTLALTLAVIFEF